MPDSDVVFDNRTLYAHTFMARNGAPIHRDAAGYSSREVAYARTELVVFREKPKAKVRHNLVRGPDKAGGAGSTALVADAAAVAAAAAAAAAAPPEIVAFWKPTLHLSLIHMTQTFPRGGIPPQFAQHMTFPDMRGGGYQPIAYVWLRRASSPSHLLPTDSPRRSRPLRYVNEFWMLSTHLKEVNETLTHLELDLNYNPMGFLKWQMQASMEQQWKQQSQMGMSRDGDNDMIRTVLLETDPYLLAVTGCVSMTHTLFEFLAFRNDVSFWRKTKSMAGLSLRTILLNCFFQSVIFLYLFDNDTSYVVLMTNGMGVLIEYVEGRA